MSEQERKDFEEWAIEQPRVAAEEDCFEHDRRSPDRYASGTVQSLWLAYQAGAARATLAQQAVPPAAIVREDCGRKWADLRQDLPPGAPLYAAPQAEQQAEREPLTDAQVNRLYANIPPSAQQDARSREAFRRLVCVIERAHGIGKEGGSNG